MKAFADHALFITLEGIEGTGKSTHAGHLAQLLQARGHGVVMTREPGGTPAGEAIRDMLLHRNELAIADLTELLLIFAARAQHLESIIRPALAEGRAVICDRFTDATYAYQGGGRGIERAHIETLELLVQKQLRPDLTILFDAPVLTGLGRARSRGEEDRFERESEGFFAKVRSAYLEIAAREPARVRIVNAARPVESIRRDLEGVIEEFLSK